MPVLEIKKVQPPLEQFLRQLVKLARFDLQFRIVPGQERTAETSSPDLAVLFDGGDSDLLLQRGGELLSALEHLAAKVLRLTAEEQGQLSFDCHDFKMLHEEELRLTAETAAERVERTGAPFALNPMNARERRIIHLALKDRPGVRTESEGAGPYRKVVIHPQKQT